MSEGHSTYRSDVFATKVQRIPTQSEVLGRRNLINFDGHIVFIVLIHYSKVCSYASKVMQIRLKKETRGG